MVRKLRTELLALLFLLSLSLFFFRDSLLQGQVYVEEDTLIFYYPVLKAVKESLEQGSLPLWTPNLFGGYPLFADGEAGALYPLNAVFLLLLPPSWALVGLRISHFFLAGFFTYLFLRSLGLGRLAALTGGVIFTYSSFTVGQLVHTNLSQALIWLPLILALMEWGWRRGEQRWLAWLGAGVALASQSLVVHVQVSLMTGLAVGAYMAFRVAAATLASATPHLRAGKHPSPSLGRLGYAALVNGALGLAGLVFIGVIGFGLAAVQLLPLYELGEVSYRGRGLSPGETLINSLHPWNLLTLLFPRFFTAPNTSYWGLWVEWETALYAGAVTLVLATFGLLFSRRLHAVFFLLLAGAALVVAMGKYAPWPWWESLYSLPEIDALRSPGRFSFLVTFSLAALAAFGVDWLVRSGQQGLAAPRLRFGLFLGALALTILGLRYAQVLAYDYAIYHRGATVALIRDQYYRKGDPGVPWAATKAYEYLRSSLHPYTLAGSLPFLFLLASGALLLVWYRWGCGPVVGAGSLALVTAELLLNAHGLHPQTSLQNLEPRHPSVRLLQQRLAADPAAVNWRVYTYNRWQRPEGLRPNRLFAAGLPEANGYSSLEPQRHLEYVRMAERVSNRLLDVWGVRYLVRSTEDAILPSYQETNFHPQRPLFSASSRNASRSRTFRLPAPTPATHLRVISALHDGATVPQGAMVGAIEVKDAQGVLWFLPLRAGVDTAAFAYERSAPEVKHRKAQVAFTWREGNQGAEYPVHLYFTQLPVADAAALPVSVESVTVHYFYPVGRLRVFGMSLLDEPTAGVVQIQREMLTKYRQLYSDNEVTVLESRRALPRAFLVPQARVMEPGGGILQEMAEGDFDPEGLVLLDRPDTAPRIPRRIVTAREGAALGTVAFRQDAPEEVVLGVRARHPAFLFLSDPYYPGWKAYVDGQEAQLYRANYLFRAVYVEAGEHEVLFRYKPESLRLGLGITLGTAALVLLGFVLWLRPWRRRLWTRHQEMPTSSAD